MKTDTDTPESGSVWPEILRLREIIKSLEMQLAASQQEVERLQTLPESRHKAFLDLLERAEKAEAEVKEIRNYPFRTFEEFTGFLTSFGIVDELAIEDSEGWDGGSELSRIEKAYNRVLNERKAEESASPDNEVAGLREENQKIRHAYLKSVERDDFLTQENAHLRAVIKTLLWFTEPHPLDLDDINLWDKIESIYGPAEGILELADFTEKEAR
jgi:hypothetical protein